MNTEPTHLSWLVAMGALTSVDETPHPWWGPSSSPQEERKDSLAALKAEVENFDGCLLKRTASHTVFSDGTGREVMFIGEAPGSEEDRTGVPFVGASGKLLDRMLSFIGIDRHIGSITNVVFWRPPGNRTPTESEIALCLPFTRRHIALIAPKILVLLGGRATKALLGTSLGIMKCRGRWHTYTFDHISLPTLPMFHPAYLLRNPAHKALAWQDLLSLQDKLLTLRELPQKRD